MVSNADLSDSLDEAPAYGIDDIRRPFEPAHLGPVVIDVADVHVDYDVFADRNRGLRGAITSGFRSRERRKVHAVRGVSFQVHQGEAVGFVGTNGSGKSTLLKAITGLTPITGGEVWVRHQPLLLGVGAALNMGLSGRKNILLGALALGLSRAEAAAQEARIVDFADIGEAIDRPMVTYSSGQRARLHFAISTIIEPEILFIDEALATGDKRFRRRSLSRIRQIQEAAGTVVLVTHNMREITAVCRRVIWMEDGLIVADGPTDEVIPAYLAEA